MTLSVGLGFGIGHLIGLDWKPSLWLGALVSLSSTMVILKTLMNQGWLGTLSSKVMIFTHWSSATILSMVLTPLISGQTARIYALKKRWFRHEKLECGDSTSYGNDTAETLCGTVER